MRNFKIQVGVRLSEGQIEEERNVAAGIKQKQKTEKRPGKQ